MWHSWTPVHVEKQLRLAQLAGAGSSKTKVVGSIPKALCLKLGLVIPVGPFQLRIFCESVVPGSSAGR